MKRSPSRVSACLLSWRRPQNLPAIVRSLEPLEFIDEILVWNNDPACRLDLPGRKVRVIDAERNEGCLGRFLCARQARNETIYVQDDDALVLDVAELYRAFCADPSRIAHGLTPEHYRRRARQHHGACHVALLGWGAFFQKAWVDVLDDVPAPLRETPLFHREADKFFSLLMERRHNTLPGRVRHLDGHSTPGLALWCDARHREASARAVCEALRLVRERRHPHLPVPWHVVIPCHNYARFLPDAVSSILQNDADYAVTIVDDASTDETPEVASGLAARYAGVSYQRFERNRGPAAALNHAIAATDSVFVVQLDADDRLGPDYLHDAHQLLSRGADVANPDAILFGDRTARWTVPPETTLKMLLTQNTVHCAAAFRRGYWAQVGGYDETMSGWQDYEFWIRMAAAGARIRRLPGDHFFYRKHGHSRASSSGTNRSALRAYIEHKHQPLFAQPARRQAS